MLTLVHMDNEDSKHSSDIKKLDGLVKLLDSLSIPSVKKVADRTHQFWANQPVDVSAEDDCNRPILESKLEEVSKVPIKLAEGFIWSDIDIDDPTQISELYQLLHQNYVEDVESLFRFDYSSEFLYWALKSPGWRREWHLGVRVSDSKRLVAFISAVPITINIRSSPVKSCEVNFLCIHKKLRSKRLAPVMIKEITRRINLAGIFQALYTAGVTLPGVVSQPRYYHRPLNYGKLLRIGFTALPLGKTYETMLKYYKISPYKNKKIRPVKEQDLDQIHEKLLSFLTSFSLSPQFTMEETKHLFLPREKVIYSYVMCDESDNISDFISFYCLPSSIMNCADQESLNVVYLYYYFFSSEENFIKMMQFALIAAKEMGFDVFNCLNIMHNDVFLDELKFGEGDGELNYYLYNWKTGSLSPKEVAVAML